MTHAQALIDKVEKPHLKSKLPTLRIGDTVDVHTRIIEGDKERTQVYNGVVIAVRGRGINVNFTVRRIVGKEGVERTFMLHSPNVLDVVSRRQGKARRAKLYYLRDRLGKARRLKEVRTGRSRGGAEGGSTREAEPELVGSP
ncbi:MAG: 50S ribosomal protein L19 [Phycisphaerae bacterium]|nr:MAG: 50S ribosomal protein L19 [Planctomycetota bacterium]KAB2948228.1 MAG: 50S ribosomal protein L19 [Phycisphaerae bacterium]MBE7457865.1 50S ribosomal protein L19 [Planctomycetia bacterium]MBZ0172003.1 50S ribosomal protein L19 [Phycisphaerales bacterium]MCK6465738.1 50S ribosomal protein L19 [Phycisphaerae bacterium]